MKRIDLVKYGFVRSPEDDFSDDGNRFTCYKLGNVSVSKLVSDGEVFLSASIPNIALPYEVYSKLPHYKAAEWEYNGVSISTLTEEDLQKFHDACVAYDEEATEAKKNTEYPTIDELEQKAYDIMAQFHKEYDEISEFISKMPFFLIELRKKSKYEFNDFMDAYERIYEAAHHVQNVSDMLKTAYSFDYMNKPIKESYWYEKCKKAFDLV